RIEVRLLRWGLLRRDDTGDDGRGHGGRHQRDVRMYEHTRVHQRPRPVPPAGPAPAGPPPPLPRPAPPPRPAGAGGGPKPSFGSPLASTIGSDGSFVMYSGSAVAAPPAAASSGMPCRWANSRV